MDIAGRDLVKHLDINFSRRTILFWHVRVDSLIALTLAGNKEMVPHQHPDGAVMPESGAPWWCAHAYLT